MANVTAQRNVPNIYSVMHNDVTARITLYQDGSIVRRAVDGFADVFSKAFTSADFNGQNYIVKEIEISVKTGREGAMSPINNEGVKAVVNGVDQAAFNASTLVLTPDWTRHVWNYKLTGAQASGGFTIAIQVDGNATSGVDASEFQVAAVVVGLKG